MLQNGETRRGVSDEVDERKEGIFVIETIFLRDLC